MFYRPELSKPYSQADLEAILDDALRVLKEIGVACVEPQTVERVTATPGVTHDGERLCFDPEVLREHVASVRAASAANPQPEPPFEALTAWSCLNLADPETGEVRPPTTEDAVRMTRLMDARGAGHWSIPLIPSDVNPRYATLTCEYIGCLHSKDLGGFTHVDDAREIELLIEMNQAAGRTFRLVEQVAISPLRFNDHGLASALAFQGRDDVNVIITGAIPTAGATVPLPLRSGLVQTIAETLALSLTKTRLGFGAGGFGGSIQPFDFQFAGIVFGGPEEMLYATACRQMTTFLNGCLPRFGGFHSMARMPDAQAGAERAALTLWQAMAGIRRFTGIGQLAVDEVFSPQQVIIDDDILALVAHVIRGLDPLASDPDCDIVEEIRAGIADGTFMGQAATRDTFRQVCFFPKLFHRYNVGHWRSLGSPSILDEAWQRAKELIDSNPFALSDDQQRAVEQVYRRALREIE